MKEPTFEMKTVPSLVEVCTTLEVLKEKQGVASSLELHRTLELLLDVLREGQMEGSLAPKQQQILWILLVTAKKHIDKGVTNPILCAEVLIYYTGEYISSTPNSSLNARFCQLNKNIHRLRRDTSDDDCDEYVSGK